MGYILTTSTEQEILETIRFVAVVRGSREVVVAQSAGEALQRARRNTPCLAIWDLGFDKRAESRYLSQWHADSTLRSVPTLLLTPANGAGRPSAPATLPDGTTCLAKPVDVVELGLRVGALLDAGNGSQSAPNRTAKSGIASHSQPANHRRRVGDLVLDYQQFQVTVDDEAISLTPTEFKLLRHFMEHPGQTFSSTQLLDDVWKYPPGAGSPDVVRMYVKRLRDKMEPDPKDPQYIVTIPGHGYQLPLPEPADEPSEDLLMAQRCNGTGVTSRQREIRALSMAHNGALQEIMLALQTVAQTCQATLVTMAHLMDELSDQGAEELLSTKTELPQSTSPPQHSSAYDRSAAQVDQITAAAQSLNVVASELRTTVSQLGGGGSQYEK